MTDEQKAMVAKYYGIVDGVQQPVVDGYVSPEERKSRALDERMMRDLRLTAAEFYAWRITGKREQ